MVGLVKIHVVSDACETAVAVSVASLVASSVIVAVPVGGLTCCACWVRWSYLLRRENTYSWCLL